MRRKTRRAQTLRTCRGEKTTGEYHVRNEEMTVLGDVTEGNDEG